jgi:hypothetical protein
MFEKIKMFGEFTTKPILDDLLLSSKGCRESREML